MTRRKRPPLQLGEILGASAELLKPEGGHTLPTEKLRPGAGQPRREFDLLRLEELASSIREQGILQPLLVRPVGAEYEIVAGERRWRAAQLAGLPEVPVIVREYSDSEARQVALIENLQREDLNLLDEVDAKLVLVAETLQIPLEDAKPRLMQLLRSPEGREHQLLDQVFGTLGESWSSFARGKLRVLSWPEPILNAVRAGLPFSLAAVIAGAPEPYQQALLELSKNGATRSKLQAEVKRLTLAYEANLPTTSQVAQLLRNQKWLSSLEPKQQQEVEKWLQNMPSVLKAALKR